MANSVDIEVQLTGAEEAKRGLEGIGETAGKMAGHFDKFNEHLGEGLGEVVGNVEELGGSFKELGSTIKSIGKGGGASLMSLVPVLGGVVAAGFALFETFQMITGAAQEAEDAQEAMGAASADLQSKLEALAEQGVIPTVEELTNFTEATLTAQFAKDKLEKSYNKLLPTLEKLASIQQKLTKAEKNYARVVEDNKATFGGFKHHVKLSAERVKKLKADQAEIREQLHKEVKGYRETQVSVQSVLKAASEQEEELSDRSLEATLTRVKALRSLIVEQRKQATESQVDDKRALSVALSVLDVRKAQLDTEIKKSEEDQAALAIIEKRLKAELEAANGEEIAKRKLDQALRQISEESEAEKIARARKTQNELFAIRSLEIQHLKVTGATALQIIEAQHQLEIDKAGKNANLRLMAEMRHEIRLTQLKKDEEQKRLEQEQKRLEQELSIKAQLDAEAEKRHKKIMSQIDEQNQKIQEQVDLGIAAIPIVGDLAETFASGFAEATFGALAMGEGFQESIVKVIEGLGKQATVQALMETAKGVSALILNPALAATHFKAAGIFGGVAALAGVSASSLGGSGGSAGGAGAGVDSAASPSGAPQTAPTPQRETAQETSTVFNINFGGAVIYDTKQAAERAMVDRLVGVMNQRNRGSRRLNLGSM